MKKKKKTEEKEKKEEEKNGEKEEKKKKKENEERKKIFHHHIEAFIHSWNDLKNFRHCRGWVLNLLNIHEEPFPLLFIVESATSKVSLQFSTIGAPCHAVFAPNPDVL